MDDASEMLRRQQEELERIRAKRSKPLLGIWKDNVRKGLNILFLVLAVAGLGIYYFLPAHKETGFMLALSGMIIKIVEFIIRFLG